MKHSVTSIILKILSILILLLCACCLIDDLIHLPEGDSALNLLCDVLFLLGGIGGLRFHDAIGFEGELVHFAFIALIIYDFDSVTGQIPDILRLVVAILSLALMTVAVIRERRLKKEAKKKEEQNA